MKPLRTTNSILASGGLREPPLAKLRRQWQEGHEPELVEFVAQYSEISPPELAALIRVDFDNRWSRNDRRRPEDYFRSFFAVAADAELAVDIIYDEYLAREQSGERPEIAEYEKRFPSFASVLTNQIRLHHALDSIDDHLPAELGESEPSVRGEFDSSMPTPKIETSYEILEQVGTGGMGVVYKAWQPGLNRFVALKMVRAIDAHDPAVLSRFRNEARVIAALRHPNIVQVYDYGQNDGLPYITMELMEGGSLADRLDGTPWSPRSAAEILIKLASAVQLAHERHVVHRDLKPANILVVDEGDGFEVKITDFGLAKFYLDESSVHTKSFAFLGTPSYMAPEQAGGEGRDIGPAADIYSLGAILYELLIGTPPFRGDSPIETLRLLLTSEPEPAQRAVPQVARDLATICDKCLHHDPSQRYSSAAELCADLTRYLERKPIHARPSSQAERMWRWCRRNPYLASSLSVIGLLLIGIAAVAFWYSAQLRQELTKIQFAEHAEHEANQTSQKRLWDLYLSEAGARNASRSVGQRFAALESIDKAVALLDVVGQTRERELQLRSAVLSSVALPDMREIRTLDNSLVATQDGDLSISADCYLVTSKDGTLTNYRLSDNERLWTIKTSGALSKPQLSHDGKYVAAADRSGVKVWRVEGGAPRFIWEAEQAEFFSFLSDSEFAVYSDPSEGMRLIQTQDGKVAHTIGKGIAYSNFAYHPATERLAVCGSTSVQVIAIETGDIEVELPRKVADGTMLAWHPSGEYLAVWENRDGVGLWNLQSRTKILTLRHLGIPFQLCFTEDGSLMASQSLWDRRLCVWDIGAGKRVLEMPDFLGVAYDIGLKGRIFFLTIQNSNASLTELAAGACRALAQTLHKPLGYWDKVSISPDGRIAACCSGKGLELWDLQTAQRLLVREIGQCSAEFDCEGGLFVGCSAGVFRFSQQLNLQTKPIVVRFTNAKRLAGPIVPWTLSVNMTGETRMFSDSNGWAIQHDDEDHQNIRLQTKSDPRLGDVSNDNRFAVAANWNQGGARIWDAKTGSPIIDLPIGLHGVVKFSPDSKMVAASPDGVTLWRTKDWHRVRDLNARGTTPTGLALSFSPDSRVLAVGQINSVLKLVDPTTGVDWVHLSLWDLGVSTIAFSPDQKWLLASPIEEHAAAQVWDLSAMRRELNDRKLDLPPDILQPSVPARGSEWKILVELNDRGMLDSSSSSKQTDAMGGGTLSSSGYQ